MIDKAKKKLKKLQKRQREQDKQGVFSFDTFIAEQNELIKKLGDVWATVIKDIYGKEYSVSAEQWNEEQLSKAKESNTKPYEINKIKPSNEIIKCQHLLIGSKVLENGEIQKKCLGCGVDMRQFTMEDFIKWRNNKAR